MRKVFYFFGVFAAIATVAVVAGFGYLAYKGFGLDKEAKAYAQSAIQAITSHWDGHEFLSRASPSMVKSMTSDQIASMFDWFGALGPLVSSEDCTGSSTTFAAIGQPISITAQYICNDKYQQGSENIKINLIKISDKWMINGFNVNSPALLAHKPIQKS